MEIYRIIKGQATPPWLYKAYDYARMDAFVFGQNIPVESEYSHDEPDEELEAIVITDDHKPVGGCRITYPRPGIGKIGRVCVTRERQRTGIGRILVKEAEKWIKENGYTHIVINSQDRAAGFYRKCGYVLVPGADPGIYENYQHPKGEARPNLGFTCVLVEKFLEE
ncbi:MAG: GNAT family N-acetyltransferase [Lachnospiraceae bacterium]|nr:GNAT family N-acetyltransferase [Lachnospiraceae bacterium]